MNDLKNELRAGLEFDLVVETAPVEMLAERNRRRRHRRWAAAIAPTAAAAAVVTLLLTSDHSRATRVQIATPTTIATNTAHAPGVVLAPIPSPASCPTATAGLQSVNPPLVAVDPDPDGVVAVWTPSIYAHPCQSELTSADASIARRLAAAVLTGPALPTGIQCPEDNGSRVALYFTYKGQKEGELVVVSLTGCRQLSAPGMAARERGTSDLDQALVPITPPSYDKYLYQSS